MILSEGEVIEVILVVTSDVGTARAFWIVGPNRVIPNIDLKSMNVVRVYIRSSFFSYIIFPSILDQLKTILHFLVYVVEAKDVRVIRRERR